MKYFYSMLAIAAVSLAGCGDSQPPEHVGEPLDEAAVESEDSMNIQSPLVHPDLDVNEEADEVIEQDWEERDDWIQNN